MSPTILWLAFGVLCFMIEALVVSGVGFLFAGLGALTAGSILTALPELSLLQQSVIFFAASVIWALLLWKPLKKFHGTPSKKNYRNMVGETAFIGTAGLQKGIIGEATWSGTIMRAELAEGVDALSPGAQATIVSVSGNILIVKPR